MEKGRTVCRRDTLCSVSSSCCRPRHRSVISGADPRASVFFPTHVSFGQSHGHGSLWAEEQEGELEWGS